MFRYLVAGCSLMAQDVFGADSANNNYDHFFKVVIVGDPGVGKSCLLSQFCEDVFTESYTETIGIDFRIKTVKMDDKAVKIQSWDCAGHERFNAITSRYYETAHAFILAYDVTQQDSFENIKKRLDDVNLEARPEAIKMLVGNKCDKTEERKVSFDDAKAYADSMNMLFFETSAKNKDNIENVFMTLAAKLIEPDGEGEAVVTKKSIPTTDCIWLSKCFGGRSKDLDKAEAPDKKLISGEASSSVETQKELETAKKVEKANKELARANSARKTRIPFGVTTAKREYDYLFKDCENMEERRRVKREAKQARKEAKQVPKQPTRETKHIEMTNMLPTINMDFPTRWNFGKAEEDLFFKIKVRARNCPPASESMGIVMDPKKLTILSVDENSWAANNSDLHKYINHRIVQFNITKVSRQKQFDAIKTESAGQDVFFYLTRGVFKEGDLVLVKGLTCKIVKKYYDTGYLMEWVGPATEFEATGMTMQDWESYEKIRTKKEHIKVTFLSTNEDIFTKSVSWDRWKQNDDGVVSMLSSNDDFNIAGLSSFEPSSVESSSTDNANGYLGTVGGYIVEKLIGQGSFGSVYLGHARDKTIGHEKYAIKQLRCLTDRHRKSAEKEAALMKKLSDENVAEYIDSFSVENEFFLVLGYCNAGDLNDQIKNQQQKNKQWKNEDIADCFRQIVSGLNCLHLHKSKEYPAGILHRDLKPGNILVCKSDAGDVIFKIADFGLARDLADGQVAAQTQVGTKLYMSPELLQQYGNRSYSFPNDVWALGCILYEICTLKRAFPAEIDVFRTAIEIEPSMPAISTRGEDDWTYRKPFSNLCSDILVKDQNERPTCANLLERIKGIISVERIKRMPSRPQTNNQNEIVSPVNKNLEDVQDVEDEYDSNYDQMDIVVKE